MTLEFEPAAGRRPDDRRHPAGARAVRAGGRPGGLRRRRDGRPPGRLAVADRPVHRAGRRAARAALRGGHPPRARPAGQPGRAAAPGRLRHRAGADRPRGGRATSAPPTSSGSGSPRSTSPTPTCTTPSTTWSRCSRRTSTSTRRTPPATPSPDVPPSRALGPGSGDRRGGLRIRCAATGRPVPARGSPGRYRGTLVSTGRARPGVAAQGQTPYKCRTASAVRRTGGAYGDAGDVLLPLLAADRGAGGAADQLLGRRPRRRPSW